MPPLHSMQRSALERVVTAARAEAEKAVRAALTALAVDRDEPFASLTSDHRELRNRLRAEMRRTGGFDKLAEECAYVQWHRMLFARFLAENNLLIHPEAEVPVSLDECADLATEEGEPDAWMVAARYAARMLPGIFRPEDPVAQLRLAPEGRGALERLLASLPSSVFVADDSLGWVYQFWQAKRKAEVNKGGRKIGGDDIAPVTQLFTEPYMVRFLLENTLGAWWAGRHPGHELLREMEYLRLTDDGQPAVGTFEGWPGKAADLKILDPCCGSGHFLVTAFRMLYRMRMAEELMSKEEAAEAVLRDNLFGLEIDPRCTQIAAFNLALAAWSVAGPRATPAPNVACSGLRVGDRLHRWVSLARDDKDLQGTLRRLYHLFERAPDVGSLLDPRRVAREENLLAQDWAVVGPLVERALQTAPDDDPVAVVFDLVARGAARAYSVLTRRYHLVATNVPYLARGKQDDALKRFIETYHNDARPDLATAFVDRCLRYCAPKGTCALVTPQNWLFLTSYTKLRERLLRNVRWNAVVRLGPHAFETIGGEVVNVALIILSRGKPSTDHCFMGLDASVPKDPAEKAAMLRRSDL